MEKIIIDASVTLKWFLANYTPLIKSSENSIGYNLSAYDAYYLALAEAEETPFATSDKKLFSSTKENSWIRWIGDV